MSDREDRDGDTPDPDEHGTIGGANMMALVMAVCLVLVVIVNMTC